MRLMGAAQEVFQVNVFAPIAITNAFLPLLAKSASPSVIYVSSIRGSKAFGDSMPVEKTGVRSSRRLRTDAVQTIAYNSSKSAQLMQMLVQSKQLPSIVPNLAVNAACPGHCRTGFNNFSGLREPVDGVRVIVWLATHPKDVNGGFWCDHSLMPEFHDYQDGNAAEPDITRWKFDRIPW